LFNQQQMMSGMLLATRSAMDAGDCAGWTSIQVTPAGPGAASADQHMLAKDWSDAIDQTLQHLQPGLRQLGLMQAPVPVVGHELANEREQVIAEAEMAWLGHQLVLLTAEQDDMTEAWVQAGWSVLQLSDDLKVAGAPWVDAIALKLNLDMSAGSKA
jgi:hypothetical protein